MQLPLRTPPCAQQVVGALHFIEADKPPDTCSSFPCYSVSKYRQLLLA